MSNPFEGLTEEHLRHRRSAKWRAYPPDVLPAWVAEMDVRIAPPIVSALRAALDGDDLGYAFPEDVGAAFAEFARGRWGFGPHPGDVRVAPDVVTAIGELLQVTTAPGDAVLIDPPVYPPFAGTVRRLGRRLLTAPLVPSAEHPHAPLGLNLPAIERAYEQGAKVHLLCSPHNPTGTVHPRATLERVAELADHHGVLVLADEIHAALTHPGVIHHAFPTVSAAAARCSLVLTSASKAWNLAGLKAALVIASHDSPREVMTRLSPELPYHAGHLGVLAARVAFREGGEWLSDARAHLDEQRRFLAELCAEHLPNVGYIPPDAGYLAWLDFRRTELGADPASALLERGKVALSHGPTFGVEGQGFARLNFATPRPLLVEAVRRMKLAL